MSAEHGGPCDDAGFSLPELLVSITLMAIVSTAIISSTVAVQRNLGVANATMNDLAVARVGVDRVGQLLRGAVSINGTLDDSSAALLEATPSTVTFYTSTGRAADLDTDTVYNPMLVRLFAQRQAEDDQWDLVEQIWLPTASSDTTAEGTPQFLGYPTTPTRERTIGRDLADTDLSTPQQDNAIFTYWSHYGDDGDSRPLESDVASRCGAVVGATLTSPDQLRAVDSISFRIVIHEPTGYDSSAADLQGWARFASGRDVGYSPELRNSANCVDESGFGYQEAYP